MDQFGKIRRHHWKERLKISKIAKFESDRSLASEDIVAPQSCENLQTLQKYVKFGGFEELYPH